MLRDLSEGPVDLQIWTLLEGPFTQRTVANLTTPDTGEEGKQRRHKPSEDVKIKIELWFEVLNLNSVNNIGPDL